MEIMDLVGLYGLLQYGIKPFCQWPRSTEPIQLKANDYESIIIEPVITFSVYFYAICTTTAVNGRTPCTVILQRLEEGTPQFKASVFYIGTTSPSLAAGSVRVLAFSEA